MNPMQSLSTPHSVLEQKSSRCEGAYGASAGESFLLGRGQIRHVLWRRFPFLLLLLLSLLSACSVVAEQTSETEDELQARIRATDIRGDLRAEVETFGAAHALAPAVYRVTAPPAGGDVTLFVKPVDDTKTFYVAFAAEDGTLRTSTNRLVNGKYAIVYRASPMERLFAIVEPAWESEKYFSVRFHLPGGVPIAPAAMTVAATGSVTLPLLTTYFGDCMPSGTNLSPPSVTFDLRVTGQWPDNVTASGSPISRDGGFVLRTSGGIGRGRIALGADGRPSLPITAEIQAFELTYMLACHNPRASNGGWVAKLQKPMTFPLQ